jgi:hypothetical protein
VVTLIHGTFAPGAPWVEDGSQLCTAIQQAFPGGVEFRRFSWSGGNSLSARRTAAARLRERILGDPVPEGTRHFVVAHSHGGNIALYALGDPQVRKRITGVATLATPFLIARKRDLGRHGLILFCAGFAVWTLLAAIFVRRLFWPDAEFLPPVVGTAAFLLMATVMVKLATRAGTAAAELKLHPPAPGRLWIGRMSGDEAAAGLQTGHLAATVVAQINLFLARAYERAERTGASSWRTSAWRVGAGFAVVMAMWVVAKLFSVDDQSASVFLRVLLAALGIGGLLVVVWGLLPQAPRVVVPFAAAVVGPLAFALGILLVLPLGPGIALYSFLLEMSAEASPSGTWTIHQYEPRLTGAGTSREAVAPLTHSWVYDQPEVLHDLTTWMCECGTFRDWKSYLESAPVASNAFMAGVEDLPVQEREI